MQRTHLTIEMTARHALAPMLRSTAALAVFAGAALGQCLTVTGTGLEDFVGSMSYFARSLAVSGGDVLIGDAGSGSPYLDVGEVLVYRRTGAPAEWVPVQRLTASDNAPNDHFGFSVAIDGDRAVIATRGGLAYVFERDGAGVWSEAASFGIASPVWFGFTADIDGDTVVIGDFANGRGAAYVFQRNFGGPDNWGQSKFLLPDPPEGPFQFGFDVSIDGGRIAVGSLRGADVVTGIAGGSVHLFEQNAGGTNQWGQVARIASSDLAEEDLFGGSVALDGDTLAVGAVGDDDNAFDSGSVYVFERDEGGLGNWGQVAKLHAPQPTFQDAFGSAVDLEGDTLVVGQANAISRPVSVFQRGLGGTNAWGLATTLEPGPGSVIFGRAVSLSGGVAAVSTAYTVEPFVIQRAVDFFETCPGEAYCLSTANSAGLDGAEIRASGTASVSAADLGLHCEPVPDDQPGLFFYGPDQVQMPFGNGFLCVGGMIARLPVEVEEGNVLSHAVDYDAPPTAQSQITAGSTWHFQGWFRDPDAGGAFFNLSDGLTIQFQP